VPSKRRQAFTERQGDYIPKTWDLYQHQSETSYFNNSLANFQSKSYQWFLSNCVTDTLDKQTWRN
jgi:hypothetical protein